MSEINSVQLAYKRIIDNIHNKSENFENKLLSNYLQFLYFRSKDKECSPSDLIDMLWHSHILDTKGYISYCYSHFGKIIHHDPNDSLDQEKRKIRLNNTLNHFKNAHIKIDDEIWQNDTEIKENNISIKQSSNSDNNIVFIMNIVGINSYHVTTNKRLRLAEFVQSLINIKMFDTADNVRVTSGGKCLKTNHTFEECNITNKSILHLSKIPKGC